MGQHPTPPEIEAFLCGELPDDRLRVVLAHLGGGCKRCRVELETQVTTLLDRAEDGAISQDMEDAYDEAIDRAFASARRHYRHARQEIVKSEEALSLFREKGSAGFRSAPRRSRGLAIYWALLERAQEVRYDNPEEMLNLLLLAAVIAERLNPSKYGTQQVADFRCRVSIELSNAHRVADRLGEAEATLGEAVEFYEKGTGDLFLGARLFDVQASLLCDQRRFEAASSALDIVHKIYMEHGEPHLAGRALISKGLYAGYAGNSEESVHSIRQGLGLIDRSRDPGLVFAAVHNYALALVGLGRHREARTVLWQALMQHGHALGRINRLKLNWLEGRINAGLEEFAKAEQVLVAVKQGFDEVGLLYKSALVTLEIAMIVLRLGRFSEAQSLVLEAAETFSELGIRREAMAALLLLKKAFETQTVSLELLKDMHRFLDRAETDPHLTLKSWLN